MIRTKYLRERTDFGKSPSWATTLIKYGIGSKGRYYGLEDVEFEIESAEVDDE